MWLSFSGTSLDSLFGLFYEFIYTFMAFKLHFALFLCCKPCIFSGIHFLPKYVFLGNKLIILHYIILDTILSPRPHSLMPNVAKFPFPYPAHRHSQCKACQCHLHWHNIYLQNVTPIKYHKKPMIGNSMINGSRLCQQLVPQYSTAVISISC